MLLFVLCICVFHFLFGCALLCPSNFFLHLILWCSFWCSCNNLHAFALRFFSLSFSSFSVFNKKLAKNAKMAKNAIDEWWEFEGFGAKKSIANFIKNEKIVMELVDMSMFILQVAKKDDSLYLLANKVWILECNFAILFLLYVYFLQRLFLLFYSLGYVVSFIVISEILDVFVFVFSNYVFYFWCGWFIILRLFFHF